MAVALPFRPLPGAPLGRCPGQTSGQADVKRGGFISGRWRRLIPRGWPHRLAVAPGLGLRGSPSPKGPCRGTEVSGAAQAGRGWGLALGAPHTHPSRWSLAPTGRQAAETWPRRAPRLLPQSGQAAPQGPGVSGRSLPPPAGRVPGQASGHSPAAGSRHLMAHRLKQHFLVPSHWSSLEHSLLSAQAPGACRACTRGQRPAFGTGARERHQPSMARGRAGASGAWSLVYGQGLWGRWGIAKRGVEGWPEADRWRTVPSAPGLGCYRWRGPCRTGHRGSGRSTWCPGDSSGR